MQSRLELNLSYARFVLIERQKIFPLGGINREDYHRSQPEKYKEQLIILMAIRLIELEFPADIKDQFSQIFEPVAKILKKNGYTFKNFEELRDSPHKDIIIDLLKSSLKGGACKELSCWTCDHIKEIAPLITINFGFFLDHRVLIIGEPYNRNEAVICDVWSEEIYPLSELKFIKNNNPDIPCVLLVPPGRILFNRGLHYLSGEIKIVSHTEPTGCIPYPLGKKGSEPSLPEIIEELFSEKDELPKSISYPREGLTQFQGFFKVPVMALVNQENMSLSPGK